MYRKNCVTTGTQITAHPINYAHDSHFMICFKGFGLLSDFTHVTLGLYEEGIVILAQGFPS